MCCGVWASSTPPSRPDNTLRWMSSQVRSWRGRRRSRAARPGLEPGPSRRRFRNAEESFAMNKRPIAVASLLAAVTLLPHPGAAQTYPARPVKIVVPAQPGGGLDLIGRTVAAELGRSLGQSFIVENVAGAGGSIASQATARAAPDGYTLMVGYVGTHGTNPAVRKLPYDAVKDFTPIAMVGGTPNILVVIPSLPVSELAGFIDYAKKNPGKLNYGTGGIGLLNHLALEQFRAAAGFDAVYGHYRGI